MKFSSCINALYSTFSIVFKLTWKDAVLAAATLSINFVGTTLLKSENSTVTTDKNLFLKRKQMAGRRKKIVSTTGFISFLMILQGEKCKEHYKKGRAIELRLLQYVEYKRTNFSILHEYRLHRSC